MKLLIFDIDGTIVDSVKTDDECFIRTFQDLYAIDLSGANWNNFQHVTDSGITTEIFQSAFNRYPYEHEMMEIKRHFYNLLSYRVPEFTEIDGALDFIKKLEDNPDLKIAFATGGWRETAFLKTGAIQLDLGKHIVKSANDHFDRSKIVELAIAEIIKENQITNFASITYIGDGLWDYKTALNLKLNFIGIDHKNNNRLRESGAQKIARNFLDPNKLINWTAD